MPFSLLAGGSEVIPVRSGSDLGLSEDAATGWTLLSATCTNGQSPSALKLDSEESVTCTFTNTRNASVTVNKSWVINGTSYTNATKPAGYSATLSPHRPEQSGLRHHLRRLLVRRKRHDRRGRHRP